MLLLDPSHPSPPLRWPAPSKPIPGLSELNEDVLNYLLLELKAQMLLRPFSQTCRKMRQSCMPILFRSCTIRECLALLAFPLPQSLWPYIQDIRFFDGCYEYHVLTRAWESGRLSHVPYPGDALLCRVYEGAALETALQSMPRLRTVTLFFRQPALHGISWPTLRAILSVPQLERLVLRGYLLVPELTTGGDVCLESVPALTTFRYIQPKYNLRPHDYSSEIRTVDRLLHRLHRTLQTLILPVESSPFPRLCSLDWPSLRELRLQGEYDALKSGFSPFIFCIANMPRLCILCLEFALPAGQEPLPIWPADLHIDMLWPLLEELTVSFPVANDKIYAHLPCTLRRLSLTCYPHYGRERPKYTADGRWHSPLIPASNMLSILQSGDFPLLAKLKIEYQEDFAEAQLLRHIGTAFPKLTTLKIFRNREHERGELPLDMIVESLSPLSRLRTIRFHPDLTDAPATGSLAGSNPGYTVFNLFRTTRLRPIAEAFASRWHSIESIKLLCPSISRHTWTNYRVVRHCDEGQSTHIEGIPVCAL
ncbi:hypothetical protein C8Q79DRAFT_1074226 [Trametes meyenii]|nr:hypothetical protein C8Q79DRAFT_1074226 [Trametes meyenii]